MAFPKKVSIVEVGPRDGLQNEADIIPSDIKIEFINRLSETGLKTIETTSFVSEKRIPQLADASEVFEKIKKFPDIHYPVLIPNQQGLEIALKAGVKEIAVLSTVSETFSQKNTHCSIEEGFERIEAIIKHPGAKPLFVRGYISCALGCPYEGKIEPEQVRIIANRLIELGCHQIALGDTIGVGTPFAAQRLVETLAKDISISKLALHFHDTYGQALANLYACLSLGISVIDSSIAGLGGCPYAKGATGNVATEDVIYMLNGLGIETGVNLKALIEVSRFVASFTKRPPRSKVAQAMLKSL